MCSSLFLCIISTHQKKAVDWNTTSGLTAVWSHLQSAVARRLSPCKSAVCDLNLLHGAYCRAVTILSPPTTGSESLSHAILINRIPESMRMSPIIACPGRCRHHFPQWQGVGMTMFHSVSLQPLGRDRKNRKGDTWYVENISTPMRKSRSESLSSCATAESEPTGCPRGGQSIMVG